MLLALWAYDNVDKVSSKLMEAGDTVAISEVLVLPPRESCSKRVNLDSLKKSKMSKIRKTSQNERYGIKKELSIVENFLKCIPYSSNTTIMFFDHISNRFQT